MRRRRSRLIAFVVLIAWIGSAPGSAAAFGTIDSGGQQREHERITRAALSCAGEAGRRDDCFEARSMDLLAGHDRQFGAVGAPDSDELSDPSAHCDGADFLETGYPRTREQATAELMNCVNHLRVRFDEGVDSARELLGADGRIVPEEVNLDPDCRFFEVAEHRAKCRTLGGLGRALHGVQDFYAHSNWADETDPARPVGDENPPGLNLPAPSPVLDLRSDSAPSVPAALSTGCYVLRDEIPGVGECAERVTHAALNKDTGLIDPATGEATEPTTPRGMVGENFAKAAAGAVTESGRQWRDFRSELATRYGQDEAALMICALTHDDPVGDCRDRGWVPVLLGVLAVGAVLAAAVAMTSRARRRTRS